MTNYNLNNLYEALSYAETGGERNPWIRTNYQPPEGSSAFGPVQITKGLLENAIKNKLLSDDAIKFSNDVLLPMQSNMLKYGGGDMKPGYEMYDYGGTGGFKPEEYSKEYKNLSKELIKWHIEKSEGDIDKFLTLWKSGSLDGKAPDEGYIKRFKSKYKNTHYKR